MKCLMVFLVLTLVVLMAEPGECLLGRLRAAWKAFLDHKKNPDVTMAASDGATGQQGEKGSPQSDGNPPFRKFKIQY